MANAAESLRRRTGRDSLSARTTFLWPGLELTHSRTEEWQEQTCSVVHSLRRFVCREEERAWKIAQRRIICLLVHKARALTLSTGKSQGREERESRGSESLEGAGKGVLNIGETQEWLNDNGKEKMKKETSDNYRIC